MAVPSEYHVYWRDAPGAERDEERLVVHWFGREVSLSPSEAAARLASGDVAVPPSADASRQDALRDGISRWLSDLDRLHA